jgi:hypothetical protein
LLVVVDQPVVFGVKNCMDRGQADVLVAAPVAGDEVAVEQLIVVGARRLRQEQGNVDRDRAAGVEVRIGLAAGDGVAVGHQAGAGDGAVRDVDQEFVAGAQSVCRQENPDTPVRGRIALDQAARRDELHKAVRAAQEFAVAVGGQHGVEHVAVRGFGRHHARALTSAAAQHRAFSRCPVASGVATSAYSRRNTWCDG